MHFFANVLWDLGHLTGVVIGGILILIFTIIAWFLLYKANKELRSEEDSLKWWKTQLGSTQTEIKGDSVNTSLTEEDGIEFVNRLLVERISSANKNKQEIDLVTKAVNAVFKSRETEPDLEAIATMLSQEEASLLSFPRVAPNLIFTSGLLGTVFGLIFTLMALGEQVRTVAGTDTMLSVNDLIKQLGNAFEPMQTAFWATIGGIAFAILTGFVTSRTSFKQSELLAKVQDFVLTAVAPIVLPKRPEVMVQQLERVVSESRKLLEGVPKALESAANRFETSLTTTVDYFKRTISELNAVSKAVQKTASEVGQGAVAIKQGIEEVGKSSEDLRKYHDELKGVYSQIADRFEATRAKLEETGIEQIARAAEIKSDIVKMTEEIISRFSTSSEQMTSLYNSITSIDKTIRSSLDELWSDTRSKFDNLFEKVEDVIKKYETAVRRADETVVAKLSSIDESMQELARRLHPANYPRDEWEKVSAGISFLERMSRDYGTSESELRVLNQQVYQLSETIREYTGGSLTIGVPGRPRQPEEMGRNVTVNFSRGIQNKPERGFFRRFMDRIKNLFNRKRH